MSDEVRCEGRALPAGARSSDVLDITSSPGGRSICVEGENPAMRLYQRLGFQQIRDEGISRFLVCRPGAPDGIGEGS